MARTPHHRRKGAPDESASTIGQRAADAIDRQRHEMREHLASALDGRDPEGVHDMRVASRRLRACLQLFAPWIDSDELARIGPAVRTVTRALGRVRELDVLGLRLRELAGRASPERALAIESVESDLERRRRRARAKMMARFARVDMDRLDHRLARLVGHLGAAGKPERVDGDTPAGEGSATSAATESPGDRAPAEAVALPADVATPGSPSAGAPVDTLLHVAAQDILEAASSVLEHPVAEEIGAPGAAIALHEVRIAAKKLRYLLENVSPELEPAGASLVKTLKGLQEHLGEFHDDTVLDQTLAEAIERAIERDQKLLAAELRQLRAVRRRALARDERAVRQALDEMRAGGFAADLESALARAGVSHEEMLLPDAVVASVDATPAETTKGAAPGTHRPLAASVDVPNIAEPEPLTATSTAVRAGRRDEVRPVPQVVEVELDVAAQPTGAAIVDAAAAESRAPRRTTRPRARAARAGRGSQTDDDGATARHGARESVASHEPEASSDTQDVGTREETHR